MQVTQQATLTPAQAEAVAEAMHMANQWATFPHAIANTLEFLGWEHLGSGVAKHGYAKNGVVCKVLYDQDERDEEGPLVWVDMYDRIDQEDKRYFAPYLGFTDDILLQPQLGEFEPNIFPEFEAVMEKYDMIDWESNYGFDRNGQPVLYDGFSERFIW